MASLQPEAQSTVVSAPHAAAQWGSVIEDLVPLSTQLLTPVLAQAFDVPLSRPPGSSQAAAQPSEAHPAGAAEAFDQRQVYGVWPPQPPAAPQQKVFQGYYPSAAQPGLSPQQQGVMQPGAQPQLGAQQLQGYNQQLQSLGAQQQLYGLNSDEKLGHQGLMHSGPPFSSWPDIAGPSSRNQPSQPGSKHAMDTTVGSDPENGEDLQTRALKRPRLVWTAQLHQRFVDAVKQLGLKNAVPKTIMQLMNVDGLTRENVASHLQKYRLQLRKGEGKGGDDPDKEDSDDHIGDAEVPQA